MVDLAFLILKEANTPFYYRDLMQEIAKIKGISEDEVHRCDRAGIYRNQYRWAFCLRREQFVGA